MFKSTPLLGPSCYPIALAFGTTLRARRVERAQRGGQPLLKRKTFQRAGFFPGAIFPRALLLSSSKPQCEIRGVRKSGASEPALSRADLTAAMRRGNSDQFTAADIEPAHRPRRAVVREGVRVQIRRWFIPVVGTIAIVLALRNYAAIAAWTEEVRLWEDQVCTRVLLLAYQECRGSTTPALGNPGRGGVTGVYVELCSEQTPCRIGGRADATRKEQRVAHEQGASAKPLPQESPTTLP